MIINDLLRAVEHKKYYPKIIRMLKIFDNRESLTNQELSELLPDLKKTARRYIIRLMRENGFVITVPNLTNMKQIYYRLTTENEQKDYLIANNIEIPAIS